MKKALLALAIIASFLSGYYKGKQDEHKLCEQLAEAMRSLKFLRDYNFVVSKDGRELSAMPVCAPRPITITMDKGQVVSVIGTACYTVEKGEPQ